MEEEIWKSLDFLGFDGYEVSNFGRVKSLNYLRSGKEQILKPTKEKCGYLHLDLYKNGKRKKFKIHKLVCLSFLENPEQLPCVNHKDENKENNHVDNLEWVTHKENINYGTRNERASEKMKGENNPRYGKHHSEEAKQKISETKRKPILQFTLDNVFMREWESIKQASEELNLQYSNISTCCRGKRKQCGNFIWKYKYPTNN